MCCMSNINFIVCLSVLTKFMCRIVRVFDIYMNVSQVISTRTSHVRHCATSRRVTGMISSGVTGILQ